jgi:hypothetical protein
MNCSSDLKVFANSQPSALNFKSFSRSLEQFFLTVGQNIFGNKIPFLFSELGNVDSLKGKFKKSLSRSKSNNGGQNHTNQRLKQAASTGSGSLF